MEHVYRYPVTSRWTDAGGRPGLLIATSGTSSAPDAQPHFFRGCLRSPRRTGDLLLAVSDVARSRFHVPAAQRMRSIALADPVLTCEDGQLRCESFSTCCGVYARADVLPGAFEGRQAEFGTTNVDFGPGMREALQGLSDEAAGLVVGADEVVLSHHRGQAVERRVPLPLRWRRGFGEVQALQARLPLRAQVRGIEVQRFLRTLPTDGKQGWLVARGTSLDWTQTPSPGAVRVAGLARLRVLAHLARHARGLRVHGASDGEVAAFVLELGDARFTLVLSPEPWRGFSGEGRLLRDLAEPADAKVMERLRDRLRYGMLLTADSDEERRVVARIAGEGGCGFDLHEDRWFRRELPFDRTPLLALHPRLVDARELVSQGAVRFTGSAPVRAEVTGRHGVHVVVEDSEGEWTCTCPWFATHRSERGPCKHVLAALIATVPS